MSRARVIFVQGGAAGDAREDGERAQEEARPVSGVQTECGEPVSNAAASQQRGCEEEGTYALRRLAVPVRRAAEDGERAGGEAWSVPDEYALRAVSGAAHISARRPARACGGECLRREDSARKTPSAEHIESVARVLDAQVREECVLARAGAARGLVRETWERGGWADGRPSRAYRCGCESQVRAMGTTPWERRGRWRGWGGRKLRRDAHPVPTRALHVPDIPCTQAVRALVSTDLACLSVSLPPSLPPSLYPSMRVPALPYLPLSAFRPSSLANRHLQGLSTSSRATLWLWRSIRSAARFSSYSLLLSRTLGTLFPREGQPVAQAWGTRAACVYAAVVGGKRRRWSRVMLLDVREVEMHGGDVRAKVWSGVMMHDTEAWDGHRVLLRVYRHGGAHKRRA
ncbi:hypothetical protein DFH06DRAFT_1359694 [Mycena polygramma]|nr:hypothetical protein DFH06DRAFT_1359694 [Mycena polygramma]